MNRSIAVLILLVLLAAISYTGWRFWQILPLSSAGKGFFTLLYILCFLLLFPHYMLGDRMPFWMARASYVIGTSWMIFFLYALLLFLALGLGRLLHLVPPSFLKDSAAGSAAVLGVLTLLLLYGGIHFRHKAREVIEIPTEKALERPLTLVLASDLHAGYHIRKPELLRWAGLINAEHPDLVLFAGDILDGTLRPVREGDYAEAFLAIRAPVYACLGNHEYISGREGSEAFFADAGIRLLKDETVLTHGLRIAGRDDRSNPLRLPLASLVPPSDSLFTLVLDHQPYRLEEAEQAGVDFQFSGHTHHGQVWPGNWLTDLLYEKAFGPYRRGGTRYYISSGLGIWGGRFRIGTRSEYIVLRLRPE